MRRAALTTLPLLFAACGGPEPPDSARDEAAILYGELVQLGDYPSVGFTGGFADDRNAGPLCSASLIAPDTVLTAAHCLEDFDASHEVYFARDLTAFLNLIVKNDRWSLARGWALHPEYVPADEGHIAHDLALLFLDAPVTGVELPALADARIAASLVQGAPVLIVGYGRDETGLSGPLRAAKSTISFVGPEVVRTGGVGAPSRCSGDSGGPTFMDVPDGLAPERRLVSVNSYGFTSCDSASTEARVDAYLDWITATMASACADGLRPEGCDAQLGPRLAAASPGLDAGVDAPSLGPVPDAGVVDLPFDPPSEGCRCASPGAGASPLGLLFGLLLAARRRR
ncbi:MAG: S1 family peptidase [Deltaproteobacteria bacterium]|nr:S1 family peptidase [Deltaproteobacteria bacterium]